MTWTTIFAFAGDAMWVIALAIMFGASRQAWGQTQGRQKVRFLGGQMPRGIALWFLPTAAFVASLWLALQARETAEETAMVVFGVRAVSAPLLALLHLRWLKDALKP
ncbi:MAG TPA: hypothetical protein VFE18_01460 [Phenylobacterium sp.]|jgi:hypothetical protein|uniref:hypothetical protein n=1 Tax=Phenylobacterium sp. TaxID=1871053 RepID=UPI002D692907|nr:hypothetical protein [Phenylobacterium sp.]HZZ66816.1 hypothetical protein [Phenylobacterium sp.]